MNKLIGNSKLSDVLPLLTRVAEENNLRLNRAKEFKAARQLLANRYKVISYKLSLLLAIMSFTSCSNDKFVPDPDYYYVNENFVVVEKWISGRYSEHYFLIQSVTDPNKYTEWSVNDQKYWSTNVCDTVQFDYIRKNRFFNKQ